MCDSKHANVGNNLFMAEALRAKSVTRLRAGCVCMRVCMLVFLGRVRYSEGEQSPVSPPFLLPIPQSPDVCPLACPDWCSAPLTLPLSVHASVWGGSEGAGCEGGHLYRRSTSSAPPVTLRC